MILVLFTASYPYGAGTESSFLAAEVPHLAKAFSRVILVPKTCEGNLLSVPSGVEVDTGYSLFLRKATLMSIAFKIVSSPFFYQDLFKNPFIWTRHSALIRLAGYIASARLTQEWVELWLGTQGYNGHEIIFYTYWFDSAAMGLGLAKEKYPQLIVVSRAHGYDLYEDRYPVPYLPCRPQAFKRVDAVFPDSDAGAEYLMKRFPAYRSKIEVALLGVDASEGESLASEDGVFRIVSCAVIRPVKRIDLLLEGIFRAAEMRSSQKFEWTHFGNGWLNDMRENLQQRAEEIFPANAKGFFPGYSSRESLLKFYLQNPVDVFVNVSESEGTPVSIMEAISCGIPVIATAVGGNKEIVTELNGLLLGPNPSPDEIADAFIHLIDNPTEARSKRRGSRLVWRERYNSQRNFKDFANRLIAIRNSK